MPAKSEKQKRLMDAAAHNPAFAKKVGIPTKVAKEFSSKSKGMEFGRGGKTRADRQVVNQPKTDHGDMTLFKKGGQIMATKSSGNGITNAKMGAVKAGGIKKFGEHNTQAKGHTKGTQVKMAGSKPLGMKKGGKAGK